MGSPAERSALGRNARRTVIERDLTWRANARRALALLGDEQHDNQASMPTMVESTSGDWQ